MFWPRKVYSLLEGIFVRVTKMSLVAILVVIVGFVVGVLILLFSTFLYGAFYNLYIPIGLHIMPVYFDYAQGLSSFTYPDTPRPPTAVVHLLNTPHQWESHEQRLNISTKLYLENPFLLVTGVEYDFILKLKLPISNKNSETGTFMVQMHILADQHQVREFLVPSQEAEAVFTCEDGNEDTCDLGTQEQVPESSSSSSEASGKTAKKSRGKSISRTTTPAAKSKTASVYTYKDVSSKTFETIASSNRPVSMPYQGFISRSLRELLLFVPNLIGMVDDSVRVEVPIIENFKEDPYIRSAKIRIVLSDAVQVSSAVLHIKTKLSGLKYLMSHYYITSAFVIISIIFVVQLSSVAAIAYAIYAQLGRPDLGFGEDAYEYVDDLGFGDRKDNGYFNGSNGDDYGDEDDDGYADDEETNTYDERKGGLILNSATRSSSTTDRKHSLHASDPVAAATAATAATEGVTAERIG